MRLLPGRLLFDLILLISAVCGFWLSSNLPSASGISSIGAGDFPKYVCVAGIIIAMAIVIQDIRMIKAEVVESRPLTVQKILSVAAITALFAAYIALLETLGFIVSTTGFLAIATIACAYFIKRPSSKAEWQKLIVWAAFISVVTSVTTYLAFSYGFGLIFP
ncbi:tripartite tricarboxylate transporter TctB family protein [Thalassospira xiamenensis]|uniref:tripartite tricarboxylate transporter TctB family protein n=1 Tax=Thalassospira xiamenensis TaxID=220697 RepID=UPI000C097B7E|nr:tripartite tricarboxylate transporter TctB family protein [Thalassospira xiamenensis]MAC32480.1 hypothetical protein [Haliea sp.]MBR9782269.1 tripartite tricarboxylate transporter TctB family protein [Rhodospirillales bacterium]MBR9816741.1 tripartite tricarboxylate transporter TctB family protein [Rhodospirillales bacterium]|tara:strand:- start:951 stop:1436 length:486 start_codon:yes stop_codon:yes gene_type:complete